ncbi:outer membrane beta-barrel protein [Catalinimonas niigatensis]|uniref:outer membrane beta-barrel protein n=1 Tax=Catalinimonas niigatensis TaxID=1397264 RepID=UPI0026656337|nr:outer membrane beta-barrel protein [Catalinimonas niigatensis]WPP53152.1 outer membrane beta-barrel protein [Catalinimonas niigatensis]
MKQFLITAALIFALVLPVTAQFSVGASVAPAIPLGDFSRFADFGFGFSLDGRYMIGKRMGVGLGVSLYNFSTSIDDIDYRIIPIVAKIEYFMRGISQPTPYIGLDIGSYALSFNAFGFRVSNPYFGFSPTLGLSYPLSEQLLIDGNVQYGILLSEGSSTTYIPINLGIHYTFRE